MKTVFACLVLLWLSGLPAKATVDSAAVALLLERRTLTLTVDEKNAEVALRWQAAFQVGRNAGKVTLHDSEYQGLDKKPLEFSAGDKFSLNYLLAVYSAHQSHDLIQQRYERWKLPRR